MSTQDYYQQYIYISQRVNRAFLATSAERGCSEEAYQNTSGRGDGATVELLADAVTEQRRRAAARHRDPNRLRCSRPKAFVRAVTRVTRLRRRPSQKEEGLRSRYSLSSSSHRAE